jgi:hypothetical protein
MEIALLVLNLIASLASFAASFYVGSKLISFSPSGPVLGAPRIVFPDKRRKPKVPKEPDTDGLQARPPLI